MKIIDYGIIEEQYSHEIVKLVQAKMREGWEPFGDLVFANDMYCQAIVRYEEDLPEMSADCIHEFETHMNAFGNKVIECLHCDHVHIDKNRDKP